MLGVLPQITAPPNLQNSVHPAKPFTENLHIRSQIPPKTSSKVGKTEISKNPYPWNTKIRTYVQKNQHEEALLLYLSMLTQSVSPDEFTFPFVLKACSSLKAAKEGKQIHSHVIKNGLFFAHNVFVQNSLLYVYASCGFLEHAHRVFDEMTQRTLVSWNSIIVGYSKFCDSNLEAVLFYVHMLRQRVVPDEFTFSVLVRACACVLAVEEGILIHCHVIKLGFKSNVYIQNSLIDFYVKCGRMKEACQLFDRMTERSLILWNTLISGLMRMGDLDYADYLFHEMDARNLVSWNSMISGYVHNGRYNEALDLFRQMQVEGLNPNGTTIVSALSACSVIGALSLGKWVHLYSEKNGFDSNEFVNATLVNMYAKCGDINNAHRIFERMVKKDVVSWDVMIEGFAMHGKGKDALELFGEMRRQGVKPDEVTFVGVLSACSHAGLVDEGLKYFKSMSVEFETEPNLEHFACVVDLLGRAGQLNEALDVIKKMSITPDSVVWGALLSACMKCDNSLLAESVLKHVIKLEPGNSANYVILSNIYAARNQWEDVTDVRKMMKCRGIEKEPGCSLIEIGGYVNEFFAGECAHPQCIEIFHKLDELMKQIKVMGYVPDMDLVLHDMVEKKKESNLYRHSEKLAIAFGLINSPPGTPIRIVKNLRICRDCHSAIKLVALIEEREIIVRDRLRFHQFKDGGCSCGDYW